MATSVLVSASPDADIAALLAGSKWSGTILYNFPDAIGRYPVDYPNVDNTFTTFAQATANLQATIRWAITDQFMAVSNISFVYSGSNNNTNANAAYAIGGDVGAYAFYPDWVDPSGKAAGDAWFKASFANPKQGSYEWQNVLHELGHTVGLKHAQEQTPNGAISESHRSNEFSLMSYPTYVGDLNPVVTNSADGYAQTLMMYDIAALQYLYGANFNWRSGDTFYKWDQETGTQYVNDEKQNTPQGGTIFMTVWDGGGNDFYDFSAWTIGVTADLRPGEWSLTPFANQRADLHGLIAPGTHLARGNIANAMLFEGDTRSLIENAFGGTGSDALIGNQLSNVLAGYSGNDELTGGAGDDLLYGGENYDFAFFTGNLSEYNLVRGEDGVVTVTHWGGLHQDGTDRLYGIEVAEFADQQVQILAVPVSHTALDNAIVQGVEGLHRWTKTTLSYYYPTIGDTTTVNAELATLGNPGNFVPLDTGFFTDAYLYLDSIRNALYQVSHLTNLQFVQASSLATADIKFILNDFANMPGVGGIANIPGDNFKPGGSELESYIAFHSSAWYKSTESEAGGGSYRDTLVLHEILHALGLGHPHDNLNGSTITAPLAVVDNDDPLDSTRYTVMSAEGPWLNSNLAGAFGNPVTPMAIDVAALQHMYGARTSNFAGNTTYRLADPSSNSSLAITSDTFVQIGRAFYAIYDTGGNDTIEYAYGGQDVVINLNDASLSRTDDADTQAWFTALRKTDFYRMHLPDSVKLDLSDPDYHAGGYVSRMFGPSSDEIGGFTIANGVQIEAAKGNLGDDLLIGNPGNNVLTGNDGNDFLLGAGGNDNLNGGAHDDIMVGGFGNDQLFGGGGTDMAIFSGALSDYYLERTPSCVIVTHLNGGAEGQDLLFQVESARFKDGTVDLSATNLNYLPTDLLILVDMSDDPANLNYENLRQIADDHLAAMVGLYLLSNDSNTRVAVASFTDVPFSPFGGPDDYVYRQDLAFTNDIAAFDDTIVSLANSFVQVPDNLDPASGQHFAVLFALLDTTLGFRAHSHKQIVILSNSTAHSAADYGLDTQAIQDFLDGASVFGGSPPAPLSESGASEGSPSGLATDGNPAVPDSNNPPVDNLGTASGGVDPLLLALGNALGGAGAVPTFVNGAQTTFFEDLATALGGTSIDLVETGGLANGLLAGMAALQGGGSVVTIAADAAQLAEGSGGGTTSFTFTVSRSGDTAFAATVGWFAGAGSAPSASGADFIVENFPDGTVSFAAGEITQTLTVEVLADSLIESTESYVVTLINPGTGVTIDPANASATSSILDDDTPVVSIAALSAGKAEGNGDSTAFTFTVSRSGNTSAAQSVAYAVTGDGGSPATAADFAGAAFPTGTVSFLADEQSRTLTVNVAGDGVMESAEGFLVTLSNPSVGTIGQATASGSIDDDDTPVVSIAALSASKAEGNTGSTAFTFTVSRTGDVSQAQSVAYAVTGEGGSPATAADFTGAALPTGTVSFLADEQSRTLTVNVAGDGVVESAEGFLVTLSNPSVGLSLGQATASGSIANDDSAPAVSIAVLSASKAEGNTGPTAFTFTVSRTGDVSQAQSVAYAVTGESGSPATAADFTGAALPTGTVSFLADEQSRTLTVNVAGDGVVESAEGFVVTLSNPSVGTIGQATASGSIANDDSAPAVSIAALSASKAEGNTGSTTFTFTVSRTGDVSQAQSVAYAVTGEGGSLATAADFTGAALPTGTVSFLADEQSRTLTVNVAGDGVVESAEGFLVTLSNPSVGTIGQATASGSIGNDDSAPAVSIAALSASKAEGNTGPTAFTFTVSRTGDVSQAQSVAYAVTGEGGSPATAADFTGAAFPSGTVSFLADEQSRTLTVNVAGDGVVESAEGFVVTLSNPSVGTIGQGTASGSIANDDSAPAVSIAALSASKAEGNTGSTTFTFTVSRTGDVSQAQSVAYAVTGEGGSLATAADFTGAAFPTGTVSFLADEQSKTLTVNVAGDGVVESEEGFLVTLSNPSVGTIGQATASGSIANDDSAPAVSIAALSASKAEGNTGSTAFTFTVSRTGDVSQAQSVAYAVTGESGSLATAADFTGAALPSGTVSFLADEQSRTLTVNVAGDGVVESAEGFLVTLSNPSVGTIGQATASGSIANDDSAPAVSIAALSAIKAEGNTGPTAFTFTVSRTGDVSQAQSVAYAVTGESGSPATAADFTGAALPTGIVSFLADEQSKTLTVNVAGDGVVESEEGFLVTLSNPSVGTIGQATASGSIGNDDSAPAVSIAALSASKAEGNTGPTAFTFTVSRTGDVSQAQSVAYAVTGNGGSPATAADFTGAALPTGTVSFLADEQSRTLTVNVAGDGVVESAEGFLVTLSNPSVGTIGQATASGSIANDDVAVPLAVINDAYVILPGQALSAQASGGVLANDSGSAPLSAALLTGAQHGSLGFNADGSFSYAPTGGFSGIDSLTYRATDNAAATGDATARVYVVPVSVGSITTLSLLSLTAEEQVAATYVAYFGRGADEAGFDFWVDLFQLHLPVLGPAPLFAAIAGSFGVSDEAKGLYPFLANPFGASDAQIGGFLDSVYNNLFNRSSDAEGLDYWTGHIKLTLAQGGFVGSVLLAIIGGAQNTAAGQDITTVMSKVAVNLAYLAEQDEHDMAWAGASDVAAATQLLDPVTDDPQSVLVGIAQASSLVAMHA